MRKKNDNNYIAISKIRFQNIYFEICKSKYVYFDKFIIINLGLNKKATLGWWGFAK